MSFVNFLIPCQFKCIGVKDKVCFFNEALKLRLFKTYTKSVFCDLPSKINKADIIVDFFLFLMLETNLISTFFFNFLIPWSKDALIIS